MLYSHKRAAAGRGRHPLKTAGAQLLLSVATFTVAVSGPAAAMTMLNVDGLG